MGIQGFLPDVLEMAGREVDLRDFAEGILDAPQLAQSHRENTVQRRKLRIGVDISHWIYSANYVYGHLLADDRHLTNSGRASLIQEQKEQNAQKTKSTTAATGGERHNDNRNENDLPDNVKNYITKCVRRVNEGVVRLQHTTNSQVLVVFDGESPPLKGPEVQKRRAEREEYLRQRDKPVSPTLLGDDEIEAAVKQRTKANRRAGAGPHFWIIRNELIHALRQVEIAFMVAPYEADSQLAYLSHKQYIDLIITEDSDLVAHGASPILFKSNNEILNNNVPRGIMLQFNDMGLVHKPKGFSYMDFSPVMMAVLFVAVGSDYCKKLEGIGIVTALKAVRKAFLEPRESPTQSGLSVVFEELFNSSYRYSGDGQEREKEYKENFMQALLMYRHPIVYDPVLGKCIVVRDPVKLGGDPELMDHKPYAKLCRDPTRIHQAIGILRDPKLETGLVQAQAMKRHPALERSDSAHKPPVAQEELHSEEDDSADEGMDLGTQEVPVTMTETHASRTAQSSVLERLSPPTKTKRSRVAAGCDDDDYDDDGSRLDTQQDVGMPPPNARSPRPPSKKASRHAAGLDNDDDNGNDNDDDDDERPATQQEVAGPSPSIAGTPQSPSTTKTPPRERIELHNDKNDVGGPTTPQRAAGRALLAPSSLNIKTEEEARYFGARDPVTALDVIDLISSDEESVII